MPLGDRNPAVDEIIAEGRRLLRGEWKYLGFALCNFAPPGMPFDPFVVKRFKEEIDPSFLPLWMRHAYRTPEGDIVYFDYHCLTFTSPNNIIVDEDDQDTEKVVVRHPHIDFIKHPPLQPTYGERAFPHSYLGSKPGFGGILYWPSKLLPRKVVGIPRPLSMMDFSYYRELTWLHTQARRKDINAQQVESFYSAMKEVDRKFQSEHDYRWDHDWQYLTRLVNNLSSEEQSLLMSQVDPDILRGIREVPTRVGHSLPH